MAVNKCAHLRRVEAASLISNTTASGLQPLPVDALASKRSLSINIVSTNLPAPCRFWVGTYRRGSSSVASLLEDRSPEAVMLAASEEGLAEAETVVLVDSERSAPCYYYLIPSASWQGSAALADQIAALLKALNTWQPSAIGLYFAADSITVDACAEVLLQVIQAVISTPPVTALFLLPGRHGTNATLNAALKAKFDFESEQIDIKVFH